MKLKWHVTNKNSKFKYNSSIYAYSYCGLLKACITGSLNSYKVVIIGVNFQETLQVESLDIKSAKSSAEDLIDIILYRLFNQSAYQLTTDKIDRGINITEDI